MFLCLLTHDRSARSTLLTPLLNGDAAIVGADGEITLTLGPFTYRLVCLLRVNVSRLGDEYDAEAAELYVQADFIMLADTQPGTLTLYRFQEHTLQVSGCLSLSETDLAELHRGGVFVRLYAPGAAEGNLPRVVLTFPLGTQVQELAPAEEDAPAPAAPAFAALTPGPTGCEVHYSTGEGPLARVWLPDPLARVFPRPLTARAGDLLQCRVRLRILPTYPHLFHNSSPYSQKEGGTRMPEEPYTGLFWGAVIEEGAGSVSHFPARCPGRSRTQPASLSDLVARYRRSLRRHGPPRCANASNGLIASSQLVRTIPAHWIAEEHLPDTRQTFLTLRQLAALHGITIAAGELLLVKACSLAEQGDGAIGAAQADGGGTLLDCLGVIEELGVPLLAVQVPESWGLSSPYWSPGQLIEVLTEPADGVCPELPLEEFAEASARFVLVQDAEQGVFGEIHCLCGEEGGALTALPVVDVLTHPGVRAWLLAQREARWQEMTRFIVSWGLLGF